MTLNAFLRAVAASYKRPPTYDEVCEDSVRIWALLQWMDGTRNIDLKFPAKA